MELERTPRILVTGGSGFLGAHVLERLRRRGLSAVVAPRSSEFDLVDPAATDRLFSELKPVLVLHLAARVGGIGANRQHPGTFFRDNMAMGLNVLEAARAHGVGKVVLTGTVCAYPKFAPVPFREDDLWKGYPEETNAPYGVAKRALLVMAQAYRQEFGSNYVMVLPVNLYGPGDHFDLERSHVIPAMIRKFVDAQTRGEPSVTLWGDGTPTREFLYVEDAVDGVLLAAERYDGPEPINLGTGDELSMRALADTVARATGYAGAISWDSSRPNGQPRRRLDTARAQALLGFVARTSFADGLARTVAWYREQQQSIWAGEAEAS
jgi:GDP-L-fucose synthase